MEELFKVLNDDGSAYHGGVGRWSLPEGGKPGRWKSVKGELVPCKRGLHLVTLAQLLEWLGPAIFRAEYDGGERIEESDKIVVRKARLLSRVDTWNARTARLFACDCAEHALTHVATPDPRSVRAIGIARAFADANVSRDELAAAGAAAGDAAGDAAWAAAWAAERKWQFARLALYFSGELP